MKKLLIVLTLTAFAAATSLHAGEQCAKSKAAAPSACSAQSKAACSDSEKVDAQKSCCALKAKKMAARKNASVKGATLLVRR